MMQSVLGLPAVIAMVKEGFYFLGTLGRSKKNCELGATTKCCFLHDGLSKGEREMMVIVWDSARMCGATNVQSVLTSPTTRFSNQSTSAIIY